MIRHNHAFGGCIWQYRRPNLDAFEDFVLRRQRSISPPCITAFLVGSFEGDFGCGLAQGKRFRPIQPLMVNANNDPFESHAPEAIQHVLGVTAKALGGNIQGSEIWASNSRTSRPVPKRWGNDAIDTGRDPF